MLPLFLALHLNLTFAWNPSPGTNIAGYNLYYGSGSYSYNKMVAAGPNLFATASNLVDGVTYYLAATAYDTLGVESDFSTELVINPPALPTLHLSGSASGVLVTWPAVYVGWTLQFTESFDNTWFPVPNPPVLFGMDWVYADSATAPKRFYRLTK